MVYLLIEIALFAAIVIIITKNSYAYKYLTYHHMDLAIWIIVDTCVRAMTILHSLQRICSLDVVNFKYLKGLQTSSGCGPKLYGIYGIFVLYQPSVVAMRQTGNKLSSMGRLEDDEIG